MAKWRIVQIKPVGLDNAFIIEELIHVPITEGINQRYVGNQGYWENTFRRNAGDIPKDWFVEVPAKDVWRDMGNWYARTTLKEAVEAIVQLQILDRLTLELKTFKRTVIHEYD